MKKIRGLLKWSKPYPGLLLMTILLTLINPITYSYVPQFTSYIIDYVLKENFEGSNTLPSFILNYFNSFSNKITCVTVVGVTLVIFVFIRGMIMFFNGYIKGKIGENITFDMRNKLYSHIQDLSYSYHNNVDVGDLIQRCTSDIDTIKTFISVQLPEVIYIIFSFTAGAVQMAIIDIRIMLITMIIIPISIASSIIFFKYVTKKFEDQENSEAEMTSVIQENVNGVRVVKAFNTEKDEIKRFDLANDDFKKKTLKLNTGMAYFWGSSDALTFLQYMITIIACILLSRDGTITTGNAIACMAYIGMLVWPIRSLGRIICDFGKAVVASNRIDEILMVKDEYQINGELKPKIEGNITFDKVTFRFDDANKNLLDGVSFQIKKGETVAIVGKTGCGKSTIANLLTRMIEYNGGNIYLDNIDIKDIDKNYLRQNVGVILQDPFMYAKTIFDNVKIANSSLKKEDVYEACEKASIHEDILKFEKGYDTFVGEKGVTLSGGQKQRLAIARMLVLKKPIIIFDDSLSAVDTNTDLKIRNALKNENKDLTSIIITHRITTAKEADKIIVLENGKVTEIGTHEQLSQKPGLYKQLWDIQGALESEFMKLVEGGELNGKL